MPHRILLVEDEAILALSEARTIQKYGYEVVTAYKGRDAIRMVESDPGISLILMDIDLGRGMDGTEAAQHILEKHDLPIAFLSSHTEPAIVEKTEGITSYGYIVKNSGETVLIASIKMAFRLYEAHMALKAQRENLRTALMQQEQAEELLLKKTEELDRYFTSSLDMLCIADTRGFFIRLNPEWEDVLGYPISELEGRSFLDLVHPDDVGTTLQALKKLERQEEVLSFENRYRCRDGSYRVIEWRSRPMGTTIYSAARDITDRKKMELDLRESEERYRSLFYENPLGTFEYNKESVITECNDRFLEIIGSSRGKIIGFNLLQDLKDEAFHDQVQSSLQEGSGYYEGNYTSVTSGKTTPVRVFFKAIRNEAGHINFGIGLMEDISTSKQFERELLEKNILFQNVTDNMLDLVALTDISGNFIFVGKSHEILGYKLDFLIGKNVLEFVHPDDLPNIQAAFQEAIARRESNRTVQYRYLCADGGYIWLETVGNIITDERGEAKEILFSSRDITSRKSNENALRESENRYRNLFNNSAIALWEEDITAVQFELESLKRKGISDFYTYFTENPEVMNDLIGKIVIIDVNDAAVSMHKAKSKQELLGQLDKTLYPAEITLQLLKKELAAIARKEAFIEGEILAKTLDGQLIALMVRINFQYHDDQRASMLVAISDITMLKNAIKEKEELMEELNHRVKNNLAMVSSLIRLKDSELGDTADLSDINHQIEAIRLIHEKLYQKEEVARISVREYIEDLIKSVFDSFTARPIDLDCRIEKIFLNSKSALSLGLIINEMATNAIKHGFNEKEESGFTVEMKKDPLSKNYVLTVSNTGNPFPEDIDPGAPETLGLQIVSTLVQQLDGTLELKKRPHPVYTISFPIEEE